MDKISERLKFYADVSENKKNKFFCFQINSIMDIESRLKYWMSKMYIRAAYYECKINGETVENRKIDLNQFSNFNTVVFL